MIVHSKLRSATSLRLLCDVAEEIGISAEVCLENTGITLEGLNDSQALHSTEQDVQAIENLVAHAPRNVGLGVAVGKKMHVNAFGIWGFAILTSPTTRAAIETAIDYIKLSTVVANMSLTERDRYARLEFDTEDMPPNIRRFIVERHCVVAMTFIRELLQAKAPTGFAIEVTDSDPDYAMELSSLTGINVKGAMSKAALTFPAEVLDLPLPKSDPATLKFCLDQCESLTEDAGDALPQWSRKVRDVVVDDIASDQKIEAIAERLSITERTLRRRLTEEGTSFRELYTDARMIIARELLEEAGLNVESVAWRVGYAEPASFVRAFSKHFGKTPGEVRRRT